MLLLALVLLFAVATPTLVDSAGVGEGPAWGPQGRLCYSGGNRIQRRYDADQPLATLRKL